MVKRIVITLVICCLVALPFCISGDGLPQWTGCHGEVQITQVAPNKITCVYNDKKVYQFYTYYTKSQNGKFVCRMQIVEVWHTIAAGDIATNSGMKDPNSLHGYYRNEYSNRITENGKENFIDVFSGPRGFLIEIMTLIPTPELPKDVGADTQKEAEEQKL